MVGLMALWLPILLSAVLVFVVSSVIHMVLPWHKGDYPKLANEDAVRNALRPLNVPPGDYMFPRPTSPEEMKSPAFAEKMKQGPNWIVTVMQPGPVTMGKQLTLWFVYALVISQFAAYVAGRALGPGADYMTVFRLTGVTAFIGYGAALWQLAIWYHRSIRTTFVSTVDGLIYGLLTAGVFGWLWP